MIPLTTDPDHPLIQFRAITLTITNEIHKLQEVEIFDACNPNHHLPEGIHARGVGEVSYERIRSSLLSDKLVIQKIRLQSTMNIYHKGERSAITFSNKSIYGETYSQPLVITDPDSLEEPPEQYSTYDIDQWLALNKQGKFTVNVLPKETLHVTFFVCDSDFYEKNKKRIIEESKLTDEEVAKINCDYYNDILKKNAQQKQ